jgi:hypothetical protein
MRIFFLPTSVLLPVDAWMNLFNCSDELKLVPQRVQNKKLSKLMSEFANGIYGELD